MHRYLLALMIASVLAAVATQPLMAESDEVVPSQGRLYVTSWFGGVISVVNVASGAVTASIPVGVQDHNVVLNPDQTRAWVTNNNDNTVSVIDTATDRVIATVPVGEGPRHSYFAPDGSEVYVTNEFDDTVSVIDGSRG